MNKKRILKTGCIVVSIAVLFFVADVILGIYFFYKDPFGIERNKDKYKLPQEFSFQVPEMGSLFITTLKKENAQFYVIFSEDSLANLSKSQDYVKFRTADMSDVVIIFNPNEKNHIYVMSSNYLDSVNVVNYDLQILKQKEFDARFFDPQIKTNPLILKYPYIQYIIITMSHNIYEDKYRLGQTKIKH